MERERIQLDVVEDFPSGYPRAGDVVVIRPWDPEFRVALIRYRRPSFVKYLGQHRQLLRCRHGPCIGCPEDLACPHRGRQLTILR